MFVMKGLIFDKVKQNVEKGISKVKSTTLRLWKRKSTTDDSRPPDITDTDVAIAKIKSQKRKINEMLKKVRILYQRNF